MRSTRRSNENYMLIDHRESPGFDETTAHRFGLGGFPVGKGQRCEVPILTCRHCLKQLLVNPLRTRDREICPSCDGYVCDNCKLNYHLTGVCYPWKKREEDFHRKAALAKGI